MRFKNFLNEENGYKIYLDMDGVLVDFYKQFEKVVGKSPKEVEKEGGDDLLWKKVEEGGVKFWSDMPWMKDTKNLWNYVKNKDVEILTAPARSIPWCKKGKLIWVNRELGNIKVNFMRARYKYKYANANSILVDDNEKNIQQWRSAGGIGIHFKSAAQALKELKKILGE